MTALVLKCNSYSDAKDWDDLVYAFTESLRHPSPDEMILLLHETIPGPRGRWSDHVHPVTYSALDEVPKVLLSKGRQEQQHVESATRARPNRDHDVQRQAKPIDASHEGIADGKETKEYSEWEQVAAALKIQFAYRRHLKQRDVARKGVDERQAHYWRLLREKSREMGSSKDSQYYVLFRVPLADILVCLEVMEAFFTSKKKEANKHKRMKSKNRNHGRSVGVVNQFRYCGIDYALRPGSNGPSRNLLERTNELQKELSPSSELHERRSVTDLQHAVLEVKAIVGNLEALPGSSATRNRIKKRWDRGWKWIFEKQGSTECEREEGRESKLLSDHEEPLYL